MSTKRAMKKRMGITSSRTVTRFLHRTCEICLLLDRWIRAQVEHRIAVLPHRKLAYMNFTVEDKKALRIDLNKETLRYTNRGGALDSLNPTLKDAISQAQKLRFVPE